MTLTRDECAECLLSMQVELGNITEELAALIDKTLLIEEALASGEAIKDDIFYEVVE